MATSPRRRSLACPKVKNHPSCAYPTLFGSRPVVRGPMALVPDPAARGGQPGQCSRIDRSCRCLTMQLTGETFAQRHDGTRSLTPSTPHASVSALPPAVLMR